MTLAGLEIATQAGMATSLISGSSGTPLLERIRKLGYWVLGKVSHGCGSRKGFPFGSSFPKYLYARSGGSGQQGCSVIVLKRDCAIVG